MYTRRIKVTYNPPWLQNGQTALGIANKLGYISVVEELKVVTEIDVITTTTVSIEEKYKVVAPEAMQETFMSDSEDEGGKYETNTIANVKSLPQKIIPLRYFKDCVTQFLEYCLFCSFFFSFLFEPYLEYSRLNVCTNICCNNTNNYLL